MFVKEPTNDQIGLTIFKPTVLPLKPQVEPLKPAPPQPELTATLTNTTEDDLQDKVEPSDVDKTWAFSPLGALIIVGGLFALYKLNKK